MTSRLPLKSNKNDNRLLKKTILLVATFAISSFLFFFVTRFILPKENNISGISIPEFYSYKAEGKPALYLMLRNDTVNTTHAYAELFMEDKANNLKKQIPLGDLGELQPGEEKTYDLNWDDKWHGSGLGDIKLVVRNNQGLVTEKSIFLAVVPRDITSLSMLSLFASGVLGAGLVISKFV